MIDPKFVPLLQEKTYRNLDEGGTQINKEDVVDGGSHAISWIQKTYVDKHQKLFNYGKHWKGKYLFIVKLTSSKNSLSYSLYLF